ncbi:Lsr2 family protein [Micrococcus luteus]|nr:Lsr2 family protein [Micrococcus luteus]MCV7584339.1 Lsr2 family protein [Micrococcus luteus]MCV7588325.1 Lsr2 family protein [Micrococcus luteus]
MATISTIADDFDGSTPAETVRFFVSGKEYAIDLNDERRAQLEEVLSEFGDKMDSYVAKARAVSKPGSDKTSKAAPSYNAKAVRAWAADNGYEVSDRGRIPLEILTAYESRQR